MKAANPHGRNWFQLYVMRDREISYELAARVPRPPASTPCSSRSTPPSPARACATSATASRSRRSSRPAPSSTRSRARGGGIDFLTTPKLEFASLSSTGGTVGELLDSAMDPTISLRRPRRSSASMWPGKIVVKGVQNVEDARRLAELGRRRHRALEPRRPPARPRADPVPPAARRRARGRQGHRGAARHRHHERRRHRRVRSPSARTSRSSAAPTSTASWPAGARRRQDDLDPAHRDRAHDEAARGRDARRARPAARDAARPARADREAGGGCRGGRRPASKPTTVRSPRPSSATKAAAASKPAASKPAASKPASRNSVTKG